MKVEQVKHCTQLNSTMRSVHSAYILLLNPVLYYRFLLSVTAASGSLNWQHCVSPEL
jgi:hypothetical protein